MADESDEIRLRAQLAAAGLALTPAQQAEVLAGHAILRPLLALLRPAGRGREAEPALIFRAGEAH